MWRIWRDLPRLIVYLGVLNFVLFMVFTFLIGGNALFGKVEAGQYYLGDHDYYFEVIYPVYLLSWAQGILVIISVPIMLIALVLSGGADYGDHDDTTNYVANLGKVFGWTEGIFSRLFDSWRKPDLECFTRFTATECIQELLTAPRWLMRDTLNKKALNLIWGGQLFEASLSSFWNGRGAPLVLHGRFYSTPHGTYLKAWYRWSGTNLLFLSIFAMFGLQFVVLGFEWLTVRVLGASQAVTVQFFSPIWPIWSRLSFAIGLLLLIALSSWWGRHRRRELAHFVKDVLKEA